MSVIAEEQTRSKRSVSTSSVLLIAFTSPASRKNTGNKKTLVWPGYIVKSEEPTQRGFCSEREVGVDSSRVSSTIPDISPEAVVVCVSVK